MKNKVILLVLFGIVMVGIGVSAGVVINANQVSYNNKTVDQALNDLYDKANNDKGYIPDASVNISGYHKSWSGDGGRLLVDFYAFSNVKEIEMYVWVNCQINHTYDFDNATIQLHVPDGAAVGTIVSHEVLHRPNSTKNSENYYLGKFRLALSSNHINNKDMSTTENNYKTYRLEFTNMKYGAFHSLSAQISKVYYND